MARSAAYYHTWTSRNYKKYNQNIELNNSQKILLEKLKKEDLNGLEERIIKLESMIRRAVIIDESKIDSNVVTIGSIVKVNDMDFEEEVEYTIVGSAEADPYEGKISNESPVGKALLGRTIGDIVDVQVPDGVAKFEILEIRR